MKSKEDPFWQFTEKIDDGKRGDRWMCKFCGITFTGKVTRVKAHLAGTGGKGIKACKGDVDPKVKKSAADALRSLNGPERNDGETGISSERSANSNKKRQRSEHMDSASEHQLINPRPHDSLFPGLGSEPSNNAGVNLAQQDSIQGGFPSYGVGHQSRENWESCGKFREPPGPPAAIYVPIMTNTIGSFTQQQPLNDTIQDHNVEHDGTHSNFSLHITNGTGTHNTQVRGMTEPIANNGQEPLACAILPKAVEETGARVRGDACPLRPDLVGKKFHENLKEILKKLQADDVSCIGIYGMGGVGKTALAMNLHNMMCNKKTYGEVFWVTVGRGVSILELQDEIAETTKTSELLRIKKDEKKRATILWNHLLTRGRCVLILDDVWQHFEYEEVGIPVSNSGLRIVLTTRSLNICYRMLCHLNFKIEPLYAYNDDGDAAALTLC